jgi:hypothetical protein
MTTGLKPAQRGNISEPHSPQQSCDEPHPIRCSVVSTKSCVVSVPVEVAEIGADRCTAVSFGFVFDGRAA